MNRKAIPSFDLYKKLNNELFFEFTRLEESYHEYDSSHPHRHNYYEILFFQSTGGYHEIDFQHYPVTGKSIHFISPEQVHQLRRKKNVTGFVLSFTADLFLSFNTNELFLNQFPFFDLSCSLPIVNLAKSETQHLLSLIAEIEKEYKNNRPEKKQMMAFLVAQLLIHCKRNYTNEHPQQNEIKLSNKFRLLVNNHFKKLKSVSEYASILNISAGHLNDTIQHELGKTASEIIHERIMLEAKRLLYHSSLSVKEIGNALNYNDPSYFTKFFKSNSELTPEQFRKSIREKYK